MLGFECAERMDAWELLKKDEVELMISLPNEHEPFEKPQFTGSFYFHATDIDVLWNQLKEKKRRSFTRLRISSTGCASSPSGITAATSSSLERVLVRSMASGFAATLSCATLGVQPHFAAYNQLLGNSGKGVSHGSRERQFQQQQSCSGQFCSREQRAQRSAAAS